MKEKYLNYIKKYPFLFRIGQKIFRTCYLTMKRIPKIPKKIIFKLTNKNNIIEELLLDYPMIYSGMMTENELRVVLGNLKKVLEESIEGDIVELGCNVGTTSIFIRRLLNHYKSNKKFHVYDSFEGLPNPNLKDKTEAKFKYKKGECKTEKEVLLKNFKKVKLTPPEIHVGWFGKIEDKECPKKIAFAFFDGDLYDSIFDSFKKVYPKLSKNARVAIHDYQWATLPGVEKACNDFLKNKPEKGTIKNFHKVGIMVKK